MKALKCRTIATLLIGMKHLYFSKVYRFNLGFCGRQGHTEHVEGVIHCSEEEFNEDIQKDTRDSSAASKKLKFKILTDACIGLATAPSLRYVPRHVHMQLQPQACHKALSLAKPWEH
jgi:hypothetical protein